MIQVLGVYCIYLTNSEEEVALSDVDQFDDIQKYCPIFGIPLSHRIIPIPSLTDYSLY